MKSIIALVIAFLLLIADRNIVVAQLRVQPNDAFYYGERLVYKVYYHSLLTGKLKAGECTFEIQKEPRIISNRKTMHIVVVGVTKGAFNLFFKVHDRYETFLDEEAIAPWLFIRRVNEGGYIIKQDVHFNWYNNTMLFKNLKKNTQNKSSVPPYTQDILSAIYYMRTFDFTDAREGDAYNIVFTLDDTVYTSKVFFMGRENTKIDIGTFKTFKLKPMLLTGNVFKDPFPMMVWVSDDKNKIPILAESEILVGSVKAELIEYSGLRNPLTSKLK